MNYYSTRNKNIICGTCEAITAGLAPDGGLFAPEKFPKLQLENCLKSYRELALEVFKSFFGELGEDVLKEIIFSAYDAFDADEPVRVERLSDSLCCAELWHGPTAAFKDMALQVMPRLLERSKHIIEDNTRTLVLTATSGDTGKAALEGFKDINGIDIAVFYPEKGVSDIQKLQMSTQDGDNVCTIAIKGNFDDAQRGVKAIFSDIDFVRRLKENGVSLGSANSINIARLVPQAVYYFYIYGELVRQNGLKLGDELDFCVPTGNFGDILAGWYAKQMGLPVGRLICASNRNNILEDFINTGVYDTNRPFFATSSPSMDILVSSNLERLLFHLTDDADMVEECYASLAQTGRFSVDNDVVDRIRQSFCAASCGESETEKTINNIYEKYGYLCDTHTAAAFYAAERLGGRNIAVLSTASPYKFADSVLHALTSRNYTGFDAVERLSEYTKTKAPQCITSLKGRPVRFDISVDKDDMKEIIVDYLRI